jgi:hypothetical protein
MQKTFWRSWETYFCIITSPIMSLWVAWQFGKDIALLFPSVPIGRVIIILTLAIMAVMLIYELWDRRSERKFDEEMKNNPMMT